MRILQLGKAFQRWRVRYQVSRIAENRQSRLPRIHSLRTAISNPLRVDADIRATNQGTSHMNVSPQTILLMVLVAVTLSHGQFNAEKLPQEDVKKRDDNTRPDGVKLKVSIRVANPENIDSLRLYATFENVGDIDTFLNLGMMLGNGKTLLPEAVRLVLTDVNGQVRELHFFDRKHPGVAGRVDDYAVPIRAGSAYTLRLSLQDYFCQKSKDFVSLKPERYSVRVKFAGKGPKYLNVDTAGLKLMPFWKGKLESNVAKFRVGKPD